MSKRMSHAQGDKDMDINQIHMQGAPEEKPQRATAAQLANRKIKDVRRRRPNTAAAPTPQLSFGGQFNSLDPNSASSSATAQPASNGSLFGQSQSFPGASNPSQPSQSASSPFSFGSGAGSSSFNFSAPSFGGSGQSSNNPFANMNNNTSSGGGTFTGFKGSMFNIPPTQQAPAQQPLPSGGLFGNGPQQNNTGNMFSFGASAPSNSSSTPATSGGIFGQSSTATSPPANQSTADGADSMQTSPDTKSTTKPSIFGASSGANSGNAGSLFGASPAKPAETPKKPLFGAQSSTTPSAPLFSANTSAAPASTAAPSTPLFGASTAAPASTPAPAPSTSLFGTSTPASTPQNPFANLFATPAPQKPAEGNKEEKPAESVKKPAFSFGTPAAPQPKPAEENKEEKPAESAKKPAFSFGTPASTGPSLFSKSETAAAPAAPASGLFQPPSTGSVFAPKTAPSAEQNKPTAPENPWGNLFKEPAKPSQPAKPSEPAQSTNNQQPQPAGNPFSSLFGQKPNASSEGPKEASPQKPATSSLFSAPAANNAAPKPSLFTQSPAPSASTTQANNKAPTVSSAAPQSPKVNSASASTAGDAVRNMQEKLKPNPSLFPADLDPAAREEAEKLHSIRVLNNIFKQRINALDLSKVDILSTVEFYMRVRATIGGTTGSLSIKRSSEDEEELADTPAKKAKPSNANGAAPASNKPSSTPATGLFSPSTATTTSPSKPAGDSQAALKNNKRKSPDDQENDGAPSPKKTDDKSTASIFAQSFSNSKSSSSGDAGSTTPESPKPSLFSTTPTTSPAKPLFPSPAATKDTSASTTQAAPANPFQLKPASSTATTSTAAPPANPFQLKSSGETASSAPSVPTFGAASGTDFMAQFKAQADKYAEAQKKRRKDEDFDSEEEDEAEWERRDAEKQKKLREEFEASRKRAKFVPGKGFTFEETTDASEKKTDASESESKETSATPSATPTGNIFGHVSATPSEIEEPDNDEDDTEEASDNDDTSKDPSYEPQSTGSQATTDTGVESSDDGDFAKALKNAKPAAKQSSGRSLFDRIQHDSDGKPKRQEEETPKEPDTPKNPFANLFATPKPLSGSTTPKPATDSPFGVPTSGVSTGSVFGSTPANFGSSTASVFGSTPKPTGDLKSSVFGTDPKPSGDLKSSVFGTDPKPAGDSPFGKPPGDHTWKKDSPIKFATDSNAASSSKPDSGSATPEPSKPFSSLFGTSPAGSSAASGSQPQPSFSFGAPAQPPSFLTPSNVNSAPTSRTSTPFAETTDTESGDGEAAESLPQVDLSRGAGEENEDVLYENRARAMKLDENLKWQSVGVGIVRVLKDRTTSRIRVLLRADPSGNIVLNTALKKEFEYTMLGANNVRFPVPTPDGALESWALRVKKEDVQRLLSAMEESKS